MSLLPFLDVLDEDVERFRAANIGVLIEGSKLKGPVALVSNEEVAKKFRGATCYLPEEVLYMLSLDDKQAEKLHEMKRVMGGHVKVSQLGH